MRLRLRSRSRFACGAALAGLLFCIPLAAQQQQPPPQQSPPQDDTIPHGTVTKYTWSTSKVPRL